mgnify:CR=1 FL=1
MYLKNNQTIAGAILLVLWVGVVLFLGRNIQPDMRSDGGYEQGQAVGHPLWTN